ncbi:MAG: sigma 54-dependent Fis family transcriptional regulator [Deltaproteobacteria bacterium]|nr:sigma 54-dependent Fis family transcriptional regulator [Nannocystaceae bacterium]
MAVQHTVQIHSGAELTALKRRRLRVEVVRGPDKKHRGDFEGDRVVVGTHESADLVLTDPTVSRHHLEIALVPEGYRIRDLDSKNGTFIDGMRVLDVIVDGGARVRIGETQLETTPLTDTVELALSPATHMGPLLGRSAKMRRIFALLGKLAPTDTTVLLTGESGTGKEVSARAIHEHSRRADGPFVVVDCAALPPTLIESELYGHERGAFTGAERARVGAFESAAGGTLFLDEIGELPLDLQTRLLGVIERRQIQPLGSARPRPIDVRLVAATNRDLRREVNKGSFRADLYFRIAVVTVELPPLRERPEDIALYVDAFLAEHAADGHHLRLAAHTIAELANRPWPGNVRELRNALERAAALGEVDLLAEPGPTPAHDHGAGPGAEPGDTLAVDPAIPFKTAKGLLVERFERSYVEALMLRHGGNITQAARTAEIDRVYLLRLLDKFGMRATKRK